MSLRAKSIVVITLFALALAVFMVAYFPANYRASTLNVTERKSDATSRLLAAAAAPAISAFDVDSTSFVEFLRLARSDSDLVYMDVADGRGRKLPGIPDPDVKPASFAATTELQRRYDGDVLHIVVPVRAVGRSTALRPARSNGATVIPVSNDESAQAIGSLRMGFRLAAVNARISNNRTVTLILALLVVALGVGLGFGIGVFVSRPLGALTRAARKLGHGNLDTRVSVSGGKEYEGLAKAFNQMAEQMEETFTLSERMNRELEAVNAELESFSYSVSHDLKAPLRAMDGFSGLLAERLGQDLDDRSMKYLTHIRDGANKMRELIDALLRLAGATQATMHRSPIDLSSLARDIIEEFRVGDPDREVEVSIADQVTVIGDPGLLNQVLQNLLGNAWKFTRTRDEALIEFGVEDRGGQRVYFVQDNGVGFDRTYARKLFAPFQRLHTDAEFKGSGIGLATVKRIIRRHDGRIWADGAVDRGATFYFTLDDETALSSVMSSVLVRSHRIPKL